MFSPFAGIGSEGWSAILCQRQFYGVELKAEYAKQAWANLEKAKRHVKAEAASCLFA